ncbi:MAG: LapA family protein [Thermodesulfobacteriota bacterium]|nr:LapA family protein [Thermodesulfobacteriota bacterium]
MQPKIIAILVLAALLLIVLIQNTQPVTFRILFWKIHMSQIIFIPLMVALGFVIGFICGKVNKFRHKNKGP